MTAGPLRLLPVLAYLAALPVAARGEDLLIAGGEQVLWLVRPGGGEKGFDLAARPVSQPWRLVARDYPGRVSTAAAVGRQLHVLLRHPTAHLVFRPDGREPMIALNPRDPRWPEGAQPLAVFPAAGLGDDRSPTLLAVVAHPPLAATRPASPPQTAGATLPATETGTGPSPRAAPDAAAPPEHGMVLSVLRYGPAGWSLLTSRPGVAAGRPFGRPVLGAAAGGTLLLLVPASRASTGRLMRWDGSDWADLPLPQGSSPSGQAPPGSPADGDLARDLAMMTVGGTIVLARALPGQAPDTWNLHLLTYDPAAESFSAAQPVRRAGEQAGGELVSFPAELPLAAPLGEMVALVWRHEGRLMLGACDRAGQFLPMGEVDVFAKPPPAERGEDIRQYFIVSAFGLTVVMMLLMRPRGRPMPLALPKGASVGMLPKRVLAWLLDFVPLATALVPLFPLPPLTTGEIVALIRQNRTPDNLAWMSVASLGLHAVYGTAMEYFFGATLGKMVLRLRVAGHEGRRPSLAQAAMRNLVRIIELCWPPNLPLLLLVPLMNRNRQRLGDVFARTAVLDASRPPAAPPTEEPDGRPPDPPPN